MKKTIIVFSNYDKKEKCMHLTYVHSHAREYVRQGYNVIVLALYPTLPFLHLFKRNKDYIIDGVDVKVYKRFSVSSLFSKSRFNVNGYLYYLSAKRIVKRIVKENKVILFDAHTIHCQGYATYLLKKVYPNIKAVVTTHGGDLDVELESEKGKNLVLKISDGIDKFVVVSDNYAKKLKQIGVKNIDVIYNGIEMYKLKGNVKKEKTIITVARLEEKRKNLDLIIKSFGVFNKNHPDYNLKIIGDGSLRTSLEDLTKELKLEDKVIFLGKLNNEDVFEELEKAYCFILPSVLEGFGIVYAEAMYCSCITIGTKGEGIDGFIKDGENGFLINPTIDDAVEVLEKVTTENCTNIINKGKNDSKKLTWERNCKEYLKNIK